MASARIDADRGLTAPTHEVFDELDRVRLKKALETEGAVLRAGLEGTIVLCHRNEAFEVEFDVINDFFQIAWEDLEKI